LEGATGLPSGSVGLYNEFQQTGGLGGGGTTTNRDWSTASSSVATYISNAVKTTNESIKQFASVLGLAPEAINGFTKDIEVNLTGLDAAGQQAAITKAIGGFADEMVTSVYGSALTGLAKEGETSSQTLQRLSTNLSATNLMLKELGQSLYSTDIAGAAAASSLTNAFGGLDKMQTAMSAYYQAFYSETERSNMSVAAMNEQFKTLGITVPQSKEQFRALVNSIDTTTEAGRNLYASVINLAPAFDQASASAQNAANSMMSAISNWGSSEELRSFQGQQLQQTSIRGRC